MLLSTLVNYACHPTTLAWDNTLISPDFVGGMRTVVETATEAPCLFIQGAVGRHRAAQGFVGDTEVADRNGRQLGYATMAVLESLSYPLVKKRIGPVVSRCHDRNVALSERIARTSVRQSTWIVDTVVVPLKYRRDLPVRSELEQEKARWQVDEQQAIASNDLERSRHARALIERTNRELSRSQLLPEGTTYPYPIIVWRIGDAVWLALDGEHYNILQRACERAISRSPVDHWYARKRIEGLVLARYGKLSD